ncbi:MAG: 3-deoxy-manno-octulosonate cytidylyltransferase [Deltaproteobacteria bacterium]|nr:3-deoxy-manno-octulosonate cytidylyltransferase [Deltaproteobacteria bacterium]
MSRSKKEHNSGEVWAIIPARYASTRFPGKPLALLAGKPMIQHVYERTLRAPSLKRVAVATDDERIQAAVESFGGQAVMTAEHPTGTDRIAEAVELLSTQYGRPGWVLNVQGDEPLVDPADLEGLIQGLLALPDGVMGTLVHPTHTEDERLDPNIVKAVLDRQGRALYFSRAPIPYPRKGMGPGLRHLGIYLYRVDFLSIFSKLPDTPLSSQEQLEQLRALENGYPIHCFTAHSLGLGVDVPGDIQKAEALLSSRKG